MGQEPDFNWEVTALVLRNAMFGQLDDTYMHHYSSLTQSNEHKVSKGHPVLHNSNV
jgi:hypothetical protein